MMLKRWIVVGCLTLCCLAGSAEDLPIFVNGVKVSLAHVTVGGQYFYSADELARAMGYSLANTDGGYAFNGQLLKSPPLMLDGHPYTMLETAAQTVGGVVVRDPVRKMITITCNASANSQGLPYYDANYKTPDQIKKEERTKMHNNSGSPGQVVIDDKWDEWGKLYPKSNPMLDRTQRGPRDIHHMPSHPWIVAEDEGMVNSPDSSPQVNLPGPAMDPQQSNGYLTKIAENGIYKVIITNVRVAEALRGISESMTPKPGYKFVVLYLTEENVSKLEQKTAWFAIRDQSGASHPATHGLSNFSTGSLRAHETTTGYVVCEIPAGAQPTALELLCDPPLSVSLLQ